MGGSLSDPETSLGCIWRLYFIYCTTWQTLIENCVIIMVLTRIMDYRAQRSWIGNGGARQTKRVMARWHATSLSPKGRDADNLTHPSGHSLCSIMHARVLCNFDEWSKPTYSCDNRPMFLHGKYEGFRTKLANPKIKNGKLSK